jgi:hypothetical protein
MQVVFHLELAENQHEKGGIEVGDAACFGAKAKMDLLDEADFYVEAASFFHPMERGGAPELV